MGLMGCRGLALIGVYESPIVVVGYETLGKTAQREKRKRESKTTRQRGGERPVKVVQRTFSLRRNGKAGPERLPGSF